MLAVSFLSALGVDGCGTPRLVHMSEETRRNPALG